MERFNIEVCFSPEMFPIYENKEAIVVIVDILRATSSICTAFQNGVRTIIPVKTRREAMSAKENGFLVAAERNGLILDFADFGNSPYNFSKENVENKEIVYSTTNGTKTIQIAEQCKAVVIGSFCNFTTLANWIIQQEAPVTILCAGWKGKFNIEDSVFGGALAERLLESELFSTDCDATKTVLEMWKNHKDNLRGLIDTTAQKQRLQNNNLDDCIDYCLTFDTCNVIPIYLDGRLIKVK